MHAQCKDRCLWKSDGSYRTMILAMGKPCGLCVTPVAQKNIHGGMLKYCKGGGDACMAV